MEIYIILIYVIFHFNIQIANIFINTIVFTIYYYTKENIIYKKKNWFYIIKWNNNMIHLNHTQDLN